MSSECQTMARTTWDRLTRKGQRPVLLELRSSTVLIVLTVSMAIFTDLFPYAVIMYVLPFLITQAHIGVPETQVQFWMSISLAAYGAAVLVSAPIWGFLADQIQNRREPMIAGLILLGAASLILTFMKNIPMLLVGRVLQGMMGALMWSVGLALVADTVNSTNVGRAMGWIGTAMSASTLSAPLLGGVVYDGGGWYTLWAMCYGLIAADIVLRLVIVEKEARQWLGSSATQDGEGRDETWSWESAELRGSGSESGLESKPGSGPEPKPEPPRPEPGPQSGSELAQESGQRSRPAKVGIKNILGLFKNPRLLSAFWGCVVESCIQMAFDVIIPLEVKSLFGWGPVGAGLIFLPFIAPTFLSPAVGVLSDRFGPKWLATFGFIWSTPLLVCLRFVKADSMAQKELLCGLLLGIGIGIAFTTGNLLAEITWAVKWANRRPGERGRSGRPCDESEPSNEGRPPITLAYALYNIAFSGGALLGPLLGGFIRERAGMAVGWALAILTFYGNHAAAVDRRPAGIQDGQDGARRKQRRKHGPRR